MCIYIHLYMTGHTSINGARRDGAGQVWASTDCSEAAGDIHHSGPAVDPETPSPSTRREVANPNGGHLQTELPKIPQRGVREPRVHCVFPRSYPPSRARVPQHRESANKEEELHRNWSPESHPMDLCMDADTICASCMAGSGSRFERCV